MITIQEEITKIKLVLENCESITIENKHIGDLNLYDIKHSIQRIACNSIQEMFTCSHFSISIHRDSNLDTKSNWTVGTLDGEKRNKFERLLKYPDITSVCLYFKGEEKERQYYVTWSDDEYNNEYQSSYINKFGDLFIVIDKEMKVEEFFNIEKMEDKEYIDLTWSMYT